MKKVKAGVIGVRGFTGEVLAGILLNHPNTELVYVTSRVDKPVPLSEIFPYLEKKTRLLCEPFDIQKAVKCDILFLSLPHTVSMEFVPLLLKAGKKAIDLSADYRIKDMNTYYKHYKKQHTDTKNIAKAVYGLCEVYKSKIRNAKLVDPPGCYPTAVLLAVLPLFKENLIKDNTLYIDGKSGISGAGRKAKIEYHFAELQNNAFAYKAFAHQHVPEISQAIKDYAKVGPNIVFCPHVIPAARGILVTVYGQLKKNTDVQGVFKRFYKNKFFVRLRNRLVSLKDTSFTNFCDIGIKQHNKNIIITASIDNLMKGAAGQAVQNMNIMEGFNESQGLV